MNPESIIEMPRRAAGDLAGRAFELLVLLAVVMGALLYPFRLPESVLVPLETWAREGGWLGRLYLGQIRAQLAFNHSPLVYKEVAVAAVLVAGMIVVFVRLMVRALKGAAGGRLLGRHLLVNPAFWCVVLLLYLLAGVPGSPTPHHSLRTLLLFALGAGTVLGLMTLPPRRAFVRKFMDLVCFCGAVLCAVSILQHVGVAERLFMPSWDDPRNRVGSFIGHNTGLSAYLLFPLSFGLLMAFDGSAGRCRRAAGGALALTVLFVIVAAQSRAIYLIVLLLLPIYMVFLLKQNGVRVSSKVWLSGLALLLAIVALQSVAPSVNPLARHRVSLAQRLREGFSGRQLIAETRLRILVCSLPLVAERPLLGHGFGTFQWVYPPAQGRYFQENPDTILAPTSKRTDLAHNDYLQFLIEAGLVGAVLLAAGAWLILRAGWQRISSLAPGRDRATLGALAFPLGGIGLQAFVDFPFHIVPIAVTAAVSSALWATAGIWTGNARTPEPAGAAAPDADRSPTVRLAAVAGLVAVVITAGVTPIVYQFLLREHMSDIYLVDANNWVSTFRSLPDIQTAAQERALTAALKEYRRSARINVFNGAAYEGGVFCRLGLGRIEYLRMRDAEQRGDTGNAGKFRRNAEILYEAAIELAQIQLRWGELRYHFTYHTIGMAYRMLWRLGGLPNYLESARRALQEAVNMNIGDTASLYELANALEDPPNPNPARASELRGIIWKYDPQFGWNQFVVPLLDHARRGEHTSAERALEKVSREAGAENWRVRLARAELYLRAAIFPPSDWDGDTTNTVAAKEWFEARMRLAERTLAEVERVKPDERLVRMLRLLIETTQGRYGPALTLADALARETPEDFDVLVLRWMLAQRVGEQRPLAPLDTGAFEFGRRRNLFRLLYFGERQTGARQLATMATRPDVVLPASDLIRAGAWLKAAGDDAFLEHIIRYMKEYYPADPALARLTAD
ncbi:MAG: O-antigen ligase family protein [Candidatus Sumerlaeaceae bacterium]|nr:O-antigen ligase family protein [Candidatus Sumerlaeaceae bacterium]